MPILNNVTHYNDFIHTIYHNILLLS